MARLPRLFAPSVVQYVAQRPLDGRRFFVDADDYSLFVALLDDGVRAQHVALHAYVLLPGEIRLLATPQSSLSLPRLMQGIGRRYVPYRNRRDGRSGPLWDRRYRSTLVDAGEHLLDAMRHIEQRPVAESLVAAPDDWRWSSHAHHVGSGQRSFISDHARYWALSDTPFERQAAYRALAAERVEASWSVRIQEAVDRGWAFGSAAFVESLAATANRRMGPLERGRKAKQHGMPHPTGLSPIKIASR